MTPEIPELMDRRTLLSVVAVGAAAYAGAVQGEKAGEDRDAALRDLVMRGLQYGPVYGGGLANHLPMALIAMHGLGASAAQLRRFDAVYAPNLDPCPPAAEPLAREERAAALGKRDAFAAWLATYRSDVAELGIEGALRADLPALMPSLSAQAFHCMIRTAYAVKIRDAEELSHGLAYWATFAQALGDLADDAAVEENALALFERARLDPALGHLSVQGGSVTRAMASAAAHPRFAPLASALEPTDATLRELARAALEVYLATGDFTALHAVTSTHAYREIELYFADRDRARRLHFQGLLAAYIAIGAPELGAEVAEPPAWDVIVARTVESDDDHDAKLVYSCREEERAWSEPRYRAAAAKRVRAR